MIRTLIVEDESWVRKGIIKVIRWNDLGMKLIGEANNGEEALHITQSEKPDLIITDMKMPKCSGIDFLKKLENIRPECEIIVISGYSDYEYMKQAISSNVFEYILKPIDESEINDVLKRALIKISRKKKERKESRKILAENILNLLTVKGITDSELFKLQLEESGVDLDYGCFSAATFFIKNVFINKEEFDIKVIMTDMENELENQSCDLNYDVFKDTRLPNKIVVFFKTNKVNVNKLIIEQKCIITAIYKSIAEKLGCGLRVGVGTWKNSLHRIYETYEESVKSLKYEHLKGMDIISYEDIKGLKDLQDICFISENQMSILLENAGGEEIKNLIRSLFESIRKNKYFKISSLRTAIIDLMMTFERCLHKSGIEFHVTQIYEENYIDIVEMISSIEELEKWTMDTVQKILDASGKKRNKDNTDIIQDIKSYIENNYSQDINLLSLSQKYFINHIYLSRLFKNQTGENFIDYLTRIRMLKAKEFIDKGSLKIKEVAEIVGYTNPYYFSTIYKKYFGITPSDS